MNDTMLRAITFANLHHKDQLRKYSGVPYIAHPVRVAFRIMDRYPDFDDLIIAGVLHDTIEDTDVTYPDLVDSFGVPVAEYVLEVTNQYEKSEYPNMNRAERKAAEFNRISRISAAGKLIKLADRIDNLSEMDGDPDFLHTYLDESVKLAGVLRGIDGFLENQLDKSIEAGYDTVMQAKLARNEPINKRES